MTSQSQKTDPAAGPIGFSPHDHSVCAAEALAAVEVRCAENELRFTPVRRRVLEILLQEHTALGAYTILDRLRESGFGSQPPVAYRALEFLIVNGFAHKIERLNAFVACVDPSHSHTPAFMICRLCDAVAETKSTPARGVLGDAARATGFRIERTVVEAEGVCPSCVEKADI